MELKTDILCVIISRVKLKSCSQKTHFCQYKKVQFCARSCPRERIGLTVLKKEYFIFMESIEIIGSMTAHRDKNGGYESRGRFPECWQLEIWSRANEYPIKQVDNSERQRLEPFYSH